MTDGVIPTAHASAAAVTASFPIWPPYQLSGEKIAAFDSTGLAILDLALALAVPQLIAELEGALEVPLLLRLLQGGGERFAAAKRGLAATR